MKLTLREKLLIPILLTIAIGMISGFGYSYFASSKALKQSLNRALAREVRIMAGLMDKWLALRLTDMTTWSSQQVIIEALTETGYYGNSAKKGVNTLLFNLENGYPYYNFLFVADTNGNLIAASHGKESTKYRIHDRDYFIKAMAGSPCISEVITSRESNEKVFVVTVPVIQGGTIVGVLAGAITLTDFGNFFLQDYKLGEKGFAYVTDTKGHIMVVSRKNSSLKNLNIPDFKNKLTATTRGLLQHHYGEEEFLSAFETLQSKPWTLVASQSLEEYLAPARKTGYYTLLACLVLLTIVGGVVTIIFRKVIYTRLDRLLNAIRRVEKGELTERIRNLGDDKDEIGQMSNAFNTMTNRLKKTLNSLQREIRVRQETEKALSRHRDTLEVRVKERTREIMDLQHYLTDIINSMPSAMVGVDDQMNVIQWNRKAQDITGVSESTAVGTPFRLNFPFLDNIADKMAAALDRREMAAFTKIEKTENNISVYIDVTIYPLMSEGLKGAVIRMDDVTERVRMEQLMVQTEKMMSVGGLAAGMAHEINNPLSGIMQNTQLVKNRLTQPMPVNTEAAQKAGTTIEAINSYMEHRKILRSLDAIHIAGANAAKIVNNMLSFARKGDASKLMYHLPDLIEKTIDLARNDYDLKKRYDFKQIRIIREYAPDLPEVPCEESKIMQVIFNIIKNATEIMHENPKKITSTLTFRVKPLKDKVKIEIQDNGPGMTEEVRKRIFEPFFTTKDVDRGTGLGLSLSYFIIVDDHEGEMDVISTEGQGTTFIISLPLNTNRYT